MKSFSLILHTPIVFVQEHPEYLKKVGDILQRLEGKKGMQVDVGRYVGRLRNRHLSPSSCQPPTSNLLSSKLQPPLLQPPTSCPLPPPRSQEICKILQNFWRMLPTSANARDPACRTSAKAQELVDPGAVQRAAPGGSLRAPAGAPCGAARPCRAGWQNLAASGGQKMNFDEVWRPKQIVSKRWQRCANI